MKTRGVSHHAQFGLIQKHFKWLVNLQAYTCCYKINGTDDLRVYFRSFLRFQITTCPHEISQRGETENRITSYSLFHCPKLEKQRIVITKSP